MCDKYTQTPAEYLQCSRGHLEYCKKAQMETEEAKIAGACPSPYGYAVFVKCPSKTFVIYMDKSGGGAVDRAMNAVKNQRPTTHELFSYALDALDCKIVDVLVYHTSGGTFFARMKLQMENELGCKIVELDARPSDSFALAIRAGAPILVARDVLDKVDDVDDVWRKIKNQL